MIRSGTEELPQCVDVIVLGSGAAGLTAALTAALNGLSCLVLEHQDTIGGTSARSSGSVWVPANRAMQKAGKDDTAAARLYLDTLVKDRAPQAMRDTFLNSAHRMQSELEDQAGIGFRPLVGAVDYRQDLPGAAQGWRPLDPLPFDGRKLGGDFNRLSAPLPELMLFRGMMVTRPEAASLLRADRSLFGAWLGVRLVSRFLRDRLRYRRGTRLVLGNALVARLLLACVERGINVRTGVEPTGLIHDDDHVTGVTLTTGGGPLNIRAARAVILAGGGFPASKSWREKELPAPVAAHTPASEGARGRTLELGLGAGASLGPSGLDNALWFPSSIMKRADGSIAVYPHILLDRAKPGSIVVDQTGQRFVNEAVSYHEFVRGMYHGRGDGPCVPAWMICDRDFIRKYGLGLIRPRTPILTRYIRNGYLKTAPDAASLGAQLNMPNDALGETITRFNSHAAQGTDPDFGRGNTIYERNNGDPDHSPNPCLGPVGTGPLFAVSLVPTPLGTSRGLITDTNARALNAQGQPIAGLYVCGNDMHSAFGGEYPGAGAQLGQAMCFAWRAAKHIATHPQSKKETP